MAKITMCKGDDCPKKESCFRYTTSPDHPQSWFAWPPIRDKEDCGYYWPLDSPELSEKEHLILAANPMLSDASFEEECALWNELQKEADDRGLMGEAAAAFIADGLKKAG